MNKYLKKIISSYSEDVEVTGSKIKINGYNPTRCPKCGSDNISAIFYVNIDKNANHPLDDNIGKDRCQYCKHEDGYGVFRTINKIDERDSKINQILND